MDAFLKQGKLSSSKPVSSGSNQQKSAIKEKKQKLVPWVEKVRKLFGAKIISVL
jgi:hypothetical protein